MTGIATLLGLGRQRRKGRLDLQTRHQLLVAAVGQHREGVRENEIEAALVAGGASEAEAHAISAEARAQADAVATRDVDLPGSSRMPLNYYFVLGVTPRASTERVRQAYRARAREIHPDRHVGELSQEAWSRLMAVAGDAERVLLDAGTRRAYDVLWLQRSRQATRGHATRKERRGDWGTRHLWYMAEISETEDRLAGQLRHLMELLEFGAALDPALFDVRATLDEYESRVLGVRAQSQVTPEAFAELSARVRQESQRKDRLLAHMQTGVEALPRGSYSVAERARTMGWVADAGQRLSDVHQAHRAFEVERLRLALAA